MSAPRPADTALELLRRLVAFDTTSGRPTRPLGDFVCDRLDAPGVRIDRFDCGGDRENLYLECGPPADESRAGVVLCGHVDVVPVGEPDWTGDPFTLREEDERLIARGACDMKGFDALAIELFAACARRDDLRAPVGLLLTCDEEIGTLGAGLFARQWPTDRPIPRNVLVGEPTSMQPIRGHKGHLSLRFHVGGRPAHSGFPHRGVNAIERAVPILDVLRAMRGELAARRNASSELFPETPFPVLTIAGVAGGRAINIVPESCTIDVGIRLLPGMREKEMIAELVERLRQRSVEATVVDRGLVRLALESAERLPAIEAEGPVVLEIVNDTPAFGLSADDPWLARVCEASGVAQAGGVGFGTDSGRLEALDCACVVWGPGDIARAHRADEWMPRAEFERAPAILRRIVEAEAG